MPTIEKGIPIPPKKIVQKESYGTEKMIVGDSMFFPNCKLTAKGPVAARVYASKKGWKVVSRQIDGGVRVWRAS